MHYIELFRGDVRYVFYMAFIVPKSAFRICFCMGGVVVCVCSKYGFLVE